MRRVVLLFLMLNLTAHAQSISWPGHKKAVIVLTYDDGLISQLNNAVPQLDSLHLTATFFLTGDVNYSTIPQWRAMAARGYELANHTVYHPCSSTNDNPVASENYTIYELLKEIGVMNNLLYAIDGKTSRTYAYPCTETTIGGKSYVDSLRKYGPVKYARIGGDQDAVVTDFKNLDPLQVPAYGLDGGNTAEQLISFVKTVEQSGSMGIFMFHGIGGDYITTSTQAHLQLLAYLKAHSKDIWITTFQQAMDYITQSEKTK